MYLSHDHGRLSLVSDTLGENEVFILKKVPRGGYAIMCAGGEYGKYLSHAYGRVSLTDSYHGEGESWTKFSWQNVMIIGCTGGEQGSYLSHANLKISLQNDFRGGGESWYIMDAPQGKTPNKICTPTKWNPGATILKSEDGKYSLIYQNDGNLVLYKFNRPIWATNTGGRASKYLAFQDDGNFVLYGFTTTLWTSNSNGESGRCLVLQGDGNLVIYNSNGSAVWASNTAGR